MLNQSAAPGFKRSVLPRSAQPGAAGYIEPVQASAVMPMIHTFLLPRVRTAALFALLPLAVSGCATMGGIGLGGGEPDSPEVREGRRAAPAVRQRGVYVVVDTDVNELSLMDGDRVLWSAPVGTGTDFRLQDADNEWEFSTPRGTMHVQYKEQNPVWHLPDWYFVEKKLPVPPADHPSRRVPNALGVAAVYLGNDIAIHGTDKPELLGQRVSHGCIRLSNDNALRLFHNVQVGTPVYIVGRPRKVVPMPAEPPPMPRAAREAVKPNPLAALSTARLLERLDRDLADPDTTPRWIRTATELISRGIRDDSLALRGVLARAGTAVDASRDREYATYLADTFHRGGLRVVVSLARIPEEARERAAAAIVDATLDLYHDPLEGPGAPWPTRRVPDWRLGPDGRRGWTALREAEERYREVHGVGPVRLRLAKR